MDNISESRLALIHPTVAAKVREAADALSAQGIEVRVVQGLRSWNDQAALYAKGRTLINGQWKITDPKLIVTRCVPGNSWHNFGLAIDMAPDDPAIAGYQPDWNAGHPSWKAMIDAFKASGFVDGAEFRSFPDNPHFQMTGRFPVNPTDEVRQLFKDGGVKGVWSEIGL